MEKREHNYSSTDLHYLFRMEERFKSPNVLANAESRGEISKALRFPRGKIEVRKWASHQLPEIGKRFGFLNPTPVKTQIISVFTQKGGTLKTTFSHALSRILALHGKRVLVIGLDIQGSITKTISLSPTDIDSLESLIEYNRRIKGLYNFFNSSEDIKKIILKTDLPTLDFIPETPSMKDLIILLSQKTLKEFRFKEELIPLIDSYDVIIFDNGPSWNLLVENSLACSTTLIQPIGCDVGTFQVLDGNMAQIEDFRLKAKINWNNHLLLPTLKENTKLSHQILGAYLAQYPSRHLLTHSIKRSVSGQEALYNNKSALEYDPKSDLANDYVNVVAEIWDRICDFSRTNETLGENSLVQLKEKKCSQKFLTT